MTLRYQLSKPDFGEDEWQAVRTVLESGWVTQGPRVAEFEGAVADFCESNFAIAVSSCTAALHLSLVCAGIGRGHEVILPSMSFIATANAVVQCGATPVFAEVRPDTFNLDPDDVERSIGPLTRAVILVHQLGLPADRDRIRGLCSQHGLTMIEDAACAIGSRLQGKAIGADSTFSCFSFHPRKLITTGDGGMVVSSSEEIAIRIRRLRQHGMSISDVERHTSQRVVEERYLEVGFNYRMTDIQAAIGIVQLRRLPLILAHRRQLAAAYDDAFKSCSEVATPVVPADVQWNVQTYAVRLLGSASANRDLVMQLLLDRGIASRRGVMTAHREPAYDGFRSRPLPISENASDTSLALPLHGGMLPSDCAAVAEELIATLKIASSRAEP